MRILLDPAPPAEGGAPTPAAPPSAPPPAAPAAPAPAPNPAAELTTMLLERATAAERRAAELETAERNRVAEAARKEQDLLAEKGNTEAAKQALAAARETHDRELAAERAKVADEQRRGRTSFRDRELALALAGKPLLDGAAQQLIKLFRDHLEAHPEGDGFAVRTSDFIPVGDFVTRELAKPEYAHFLRAGTQGGGGASGGGTPAPTPSQTAADPAAKRLAQLKALVGVEPSGAPGLNGLYGG